MTIYDKLRMKGRTLQQADDILFNMGSELEIIVNGISDQQEAVDILDSRMDIAEENINTHTTQIGTLQSTTSGHTTQITALGNVDISLQNQITAVVAIANANATHINGLVKTANISATSTSATLTLTFYDNSTLPLVFPVSSSTGTGMMSASIYNTLQNCVTNIASLQSAIRYGPVVYPSAYPTQLELSSLYAGLRITYPTLPEIPLDGFTLRDSNNPQLTSITYSYSALGDAYGNHWLANSNNIGLATDSSPGITKGMSDLPANYGMIYVESDGTMSVLGYDAIISRLSTLETNSQIKSNLVTAFQLTPDNTHYPSEKLIKDTISAMMIIKRNITIASTDWVTNDESADIYAKGYIYKYKILVTGMLETMTPKGEASLTDFLSNKLWSRYQSSDGGVTIYSKTATATTIAWIGGEIRTVVS
jgi:hypothetical protein